MSDIVHGMCCVCVTATICVCACVCVDMSVVYMGVAMQNGCCFFSLVCAGEGGGPSNLVGFESISEQEGCSIDRLRGNGNFRIFGSK